jgi:hypothetical protein
VVVVAGDGEVCAEDTSDDTAPTAAAQPIVPTPAVTASQPANVIAPAANPAMSDRCDAVHAFPADAAFLTSWPSTFPA